MVSWEGVTTWGRFIPRLRRLQSRAPLVDVTQVRRLAILRYDGMGDLVMCSGMLRELRRQLPRARITMACRTPWAAWMKTCPWVDEVVHVENTFPKRFNDLRRVMQMLRFARRELWPRELEVLLQPGTHHCYSHARALAWLSGAPFRMCWEDPGGGVDAGGRFHTHCLPFPNTMHEADKCFEMLQALGLKPEGRRLDTWWTAEEERLADGIVGEMRGTNCKVVALGVASSEVARRWPRENFLKVVREIRRRGNVAFLVFGGPDVRETCEWMIAQEGDSVRYVGARESLGTNWAGIAKCDLYLGNDTGFTHMAAAARTPVVDIRGLSPNAPRGTRGDPLTTGPYDTLSRVVRPPVDTPGGPTLDASLVRVESVLAATLDLLGLSRMAGQIGKE